MGDGCVCLGVFGEESAEEMSEGWTGVRSASSCFRDENKKLRAFRPIRINECGSLQASLHDPPSFIRALLGAYEKLRFF